MYDSYYEADCARGLHNEKLRDAEERHLIRLMQRQQPGLLSRLYKKLIEWANVTVQSLQNHEQTSGAGSTHHVLSGK